MGHRTRDKIAKLIHDQSSKEASEDNDSDVDSENELDIATLKIRRDPWLVSF